MRIFMTGGTGNLGTHLVPALIADGHTLTLLSATPHNPFKNEPSISFIIGDLLEPAGYREALTDMDAIIHMAAITHTNDTALYYHINTEGTKILLETATLKKVPRFIFISTRAVGKEGGAYSHSKARAERLVEQSGLAWTIVRPAEVYGVTENEAIAKVIASVEAMPIVPIIGHGRYRVAPVHIKDVIQALTAIVSTPASIGKAYTLAGPEDMTYNEFIKLVLSAKRVRKPIVRIPLFVISLAAELFARLHMRAPFIVRDQLPRLILKKSADNTQAIADLGYRPIPLKQYIVNT